MMIISYLLAVIFAIIMAMVGFILWKEGLTFVLQVEAVSIILLYILIMTEWLGAFTLASVTGLLSIFVPAVVGLILGIIFANLHSKHIS